ncbi:hypothetical protein [Jannaschia marina]|uniref:hypothetical protein n=1 Tax=Jannaschia marina TaxID=2741674 RepID=UPI0015C7D889|nr:hypothetical protein [Jannaschia marina]
MSAHVAIPLLAAGSLVLTFAVVAVLQPRLRWLRFLGAGILISSLVMGLTVVLFGVPL